MAVKGANEIFVRGHPPIGFCAGYNPSEFAEKFSNKSLNVCFHYGSPNIIGSLEIQSEVVFLDPFLVQRLVPQTSIKEHKLVHVPREEKLRLCLVCFAICVLHECVVIRIPPFECAR